jgi:2-keto-4-pentenoate hydratase/2-oxohepta-3-ene-1,7-dioic acid hydratase in catechol pathway
MKIAHARERHARAGAPFRLFAALDADAQATTWLDLEVARRRAIRHDGRLAHNSVLFRQPITTLDDHLARGLRVESLGEIWTSYRREGEDDDALAAAADLMFGSPILKPSSLRDFYAFERHVGTMWSRREMPIPEAWYRLAIFYFSNTSEIRGPGEPVWAPRGSSELDYELEIAALVDTPVKDLSAQRGEEAIGGYMLMNDWSARDLQRDETAVRLGPAKGKDFGTTLGPYLVTPDELADARSAKGYDLVATATINGQEISRGNWNQIAFSFGEMVERASADVWVNSGSVLGSGTVGTGCLLEMKDESGFGRYLQAGDSVTLKVDRLGELTTPIVERPDRRASGT